MTTSLQLIILGLAGVVVGIINTLAGGGSVISLSLLMFFGLDANLANGTNRVAIVFQTMAGVKKFSDSRRLDLPRGWHYALPALLGSLAGAWVASDINKQLLEYLLLGVMAFMVVLMFVDPEAWIAGNTSRHQAKPGVVAWLMFAAIGFYGGFVQVGIGYFLLAALVLQSGYELVKANALKVFITFLYSPFALAIFVWHHQVDWLYGLVLAMGTFAGGWIGARMAVKRGASFVRWIIVAVVVMTFVKTLLLR
ncbi:MAG: sulfite exporter TauE/SafE family protein [Bacteroidales bacterium]|nr:sulfite exporter TauE/SafE family protein [Bacteroidales bacterium]MDD3665442.1 sulfite exporter TauE/SafE family protein [Bacteroidales bacterium]